MSVNVDKSARNAGYYELVEARLQKLDKPENSVDIKGIIYAWSLNESMNHGYMDGEIVVFDAAGLFYDFNIKANKETKGLRGEEEIVITYKDYFNRELTHRFFVYAISQWKPAIPNNETALTYTLHFTSKEKFYTDRVQIRRSYKNGLISDYVQLMFEQYWMNAEPGAISTYGKDVLGIQDIIIEETKGKQDIIIPNYRPERAMHLLTRRAISSKSENKTQTFRFFQNRARFYFRSHDEMNVSPDPLLLGNGLRRNKFIQINDADQSPLGQEYIMQNIVDIKFPNNVNTVKDMVEGNYYRSTTEIDFMNRVIQTTPYKYLDEYENYNLPDVYGERDGFGFNNVRSRHTKEFVDKHMNNFQDTLVVKDYPYVSAGGKNDYIRQPAFYDQMYNPKVMNLYHHQNEMVEMEVYGRNTLGVGDTVEIEIVLSIGNRDGKVIIDEERSGYYLIEEINNRFVEDTYMQNLKMSKSGIRGLPESTRNYNNRPQTMSTFLENTLGTYENRILNKESS